MSSHPAETSPESKKPAPRKRRRWWRILLGFVLVIIVIGVIARLMMPSTLRWYVNRTLDRNPLYEGRIGGIEVHLWRGAYSIDDVRLDKRMGNVPVPFVAMKKLDLAMQWDALLHGKLVGKVLMEKPELNFVDNGDETNSQTGDSGPWLEMLSDLFPFKINSTQIKDGSIHFRAYNRKPEVDIYLSQLDASIDNLSNIRDETAPLLATVKATGLAMDQAKFEYEMKLDPFSYRPSFELAVRLLGLDVTKLNEFAEAYGGIDFKNGIFDLVVELNAREGTIDGYVKPLFRNLQVMALSDVKDHNILEIFWEGVVGVTTELLKNQPRDQLATEIPITGDLSGPKPDILATIGNVLRNAFIRAYLPKLRGTTPDINHVDFGHGSITEPTAVGTE